MTTFNPPYGMDNNFNGDMDAPPTVTYTDKDGKVVDRAEIDAYAASLEAVAPTP